MSAVMPTRLESLASAVALALPGQLQMVANRLSELTYEVAADGLLQAAAVLRDSPDLKFEMCMDVCGVDYLEHGRAEWKTEGATSSGFSRGVARRSARLADIGTPPGSAPAAEAASGGAAGRRFAVVYHLLSVSHNHRVRLKVFCADDTAPMVQAFVKSYKAKYGADPDALAALGYDATNIMLDAIQRAGKTDGDAIRDSLTKTDLQTVTGKVKFDGDRNPVKSAVIIEIKGGKQVFKTTVNP